MTPDDLIAAVRARLDETERIALAASPGPWGYDSYAAVFSAPKVGPHDEWLSGVDDQHTLERYGICTLCGDWKQPPYVPSPGLGHGCRLFDDSYRLDPLVAHVPAHHGDTAIDQHAADAEHIAYHDPAAVLRRVTADRRILAEHRPYESVDWYCASCGDVPQVLFPCLTVRDLADGLGIDLEETP